MKKLLLIIFLTILSIINICNAAIYESIGNAVIENNDLKTADRKALDNALIEAIKKHFENVTLDKNKIPEITNEYIRFVKSYKILDRYVKDYTVYYHMIVDVDEITVDDLPLFFNTLKQSVVYYFENTPENISPDDLNKLFNHYNLSLKYQDSFTFNLPPNPSYDDILNEFAKNDARYLIIFTYKKLQNSLNNIGCKTELKVETYTKTKKFKTIKIISTKSLPDMTECIKDSLMSSIDKALNYIKTNYIELPKIEKVQQNITITFINFKDFNTIQKFLEELTNRHYIDEVKIKSFSMDEAVYDVTTVLSLENLIAKLKLLKNNSNYNIINFAEGQLIIDFSK
ncbi:hypothetical protein DEFDS_0575 [Deferribacter desulfuricans SSM1]|uniref:Uncharacterized protein n=1 Tax=Deferribacter desulfuricans (strain DSM 14783 / JCM 11476 / NBRC 101012 / SSM1) TaxID=639282 RepID=D3PBT4_DEFDS|nr:hypothetical protein [Deferribacter desulfuricans]BAI80057.1 hypothetical protein DEFDS_0575 [Deferribacter desulfuricans SSM1]